MRNKKLHLFSVFALLWHVSLVQAAPPQIELPAEPAETSPAEKQAPAAAPISTSVRDPNDREWEEYENRIVKVHLRAKGAWTVMEYKETETSGALGFTLSRVPLVTFSVTRDPMDGTFDEWVSSSALASLYPSGCTRSSTSFADRKAVRTKGIVKDGRLDESYFSTDGTSIYQVSFTAPEDGWKEAQDKFADLKRSFRWLPK